jgi:ADP-dependent NAD(P)H-hydrate dehydratase / NAD(P)H-hydrate epimerase
MQLECISSREMRALEVNAEYFGVSLLQLMENAGRSVAEEIASRFQKNQRVAIFCGLGGNGGDGFVLARHLAALGFRGISVFLAGKGKDISHEAAQANWLALQQLVESISIQEVADSSALLKVEADVIVDALLGTGTKGKLKTPVSQLVSCINSTKAFKVAVDIPTGINSDTGETLEDAVKADLTVTFHKAKQGLKAAKKYTGDLLVKSIGLPAELETFAGPGDVLLVTQNRALSAHKGDFGKLLVVGGSEVFSGAPTLVSLAALRTGVDIVYTAVPEATAHDVASLSPDLITVKLAGANLNVDNVQVLKSYLHMVDAVALGPGLGLSAETKAFVKEFIEAVEEVKKPLLLDADGLKAYANFKRPLKMPLVLTPHAGEFAILTGKQLPADIKGKAEVVRQAAAELKAVILVKGGVDVVSDGMRVKLNFTGNPGMTVGGTGDVLSGVVAALLAQKADAFEAAVAGVFVNGAAGDFVAAELGAHMVASDLIDYIPQVWNNPMSHVKVRGVSGKSSRR